MSIELLWIIPVIGLGVFIFLVVFLVQRKFIVNSDLDLKKQVNQFNSGVHHSSSTQERPVLELENRLHELESAITHITQSISIQHRSIDSFAVDDQIRSNDTVELKRKLVELHNEYDNVLNENYSLRSRLRKLLNEDTGGLKESQKKVNLRLFEDTRFLNPSNFEDTAEIDISKQG